MYTTRLENTQIGIQAQAELAHKPLAAQFYEVERCRLKIVAMNCLCVPALVLSLGMSAPLEAAEPSPPMLAVVNKGDSSVSIINLDNQKTVWTAKVGYLPHEAATAARGSRIYVANYGNEHVRSSSLANNPGNSVTILKLTEPRSVKEIDLGPARCAPHGIMASADGDRVYVTCEARQEILVIDAINERISHAIPINQAGSHMLAISSDEARAYVANFWHGTVTVLDLVNRKIIDHIVTAEGTEGIGLSPDNRFLYLTSVRTHELLKVDTASLKIVLRRKVGDGARTSPIRVLATPDGENLVVNVEGEGTVHVYDPANLELKHVIRVGRQNIGLVIGDSTYAYSANMMDGTVSVVNVKTGVAEATIRTGSLPDGMSYIPGASR
jgi:YVTN family beta-propeller protein